MTTTTKTTADTIATLRSLARSIGATVEDDRASCAIRITAVPGNCFDQDNHETVAWYEESDWRMDEIRDLCADIRRDDHATSEPCVIPACEWCAEAAA